MTSRSKVFILSTGAVAAWMSVTSARAEEPDSKCASLSSITLPGKLDTVTTCQRLLSEWNKPVSQDIPATRFDFTEENPAFAAALRSSLKRFGGKEMIVVKLDKLPTKTTEVQLRTAVAPEYATGALGAWLGAVDRSHKGIYRTTDEQSLNLVPIAFEWVIMPLFKKLFKKDPLAPAKKVDAIIVNYGSTHADAGKIKRVCFVKKGSVSALKKKVEAGRGDQAALERAIADLCPDRL